MKTGADAEDGGGLANRHRLGQRAIEGDVEACPATRTAAPLNHDHRTNGKGWCLHAKFPDVNSHPDSKAGGTDAGPRYPCVATQRGVAAGRAHEGGDRSSDPRRPAATRRRTDAGGLPRAAEAVPVRPRGRPDAVGEQDRRHPPARQPGHLPGAGRRGASACASWGGDWPFSGLTMVGLERLDDLQACVESVVADGVEGDVIEAGTWRGGASILARATLDSLGADERTVWSWPTPSRDCRRPTRGSFPEDRDLDLSRVDFLCASGSRRCGVTSPASGSSRGSSSCEGFFNETLPDASRSSLVGRSPRRRHLRGDLGRARVAVPGPVQGRLPDRRRLRADPGVPGGRRRLPSRARHHRADREDRLERGPLAPRGRAGPCVAEAPRARPRGPRRRVRDPPARNGERDGRIPTERELALEREAERAA